MLLYLVQHAEAKAESEDPERSLTEEGIAKSKKVALFLKNMGLKVDSIFHSGKKRAFQTAQIFSEYLNPAEGIEGSDNLAPLDDPTIWFKRLLSMDKDVMIVGHLPHLEKLVSLLLSGGKEFVKVSFKYAGVVCLRRLEGERFSLEWMIIPEILQ